MIERILILTKDIKFADILTNHLQAWGVETIRAICDDSRVPFGKLSADYDFLIIDRHFLGNTRYTAALVRAIRAEFLNPILAFENFAGDGNMSLMKVAGCNYICNRFGDMQALIDNIVIKTTEIIDALKEFNEEVRSAPTR